MDSSKVKVDYDRAAKLYARFRRVDPAVLEQLLAQLCSSSRVLEVGCGSGNYISTLSKIVGCECHRIEPSEAMLAEARKNDAAILWRKGSAESLSYPADTFTFIFCVDVIHHISNVPLFIAEMFRTLSRGGRACIVTESESDILARQPLSFYFPDTIDLELDRYPRIDYLKRLLREAAFSGIATRTAEFAYALENADSYKEKAFSCLQLISNEAHARGVARMTEDLLRGPIACSSRYLMLWATK
jgi:ubiquinone/menaquinone biosynthesis C-methylase UbiE